MGLFSRLFPLSPAEMAPATDTWAERKARYKPMMDAYHEAFLAASEKYTNEGKDEYSGKHHFADPLTIGGSTFRASDITTIQVEVDLERYRLFDHLISAEIYDLGPVPEDTARKYADADAIIRPYIRFGLVNGESKRLYVEWNERYSAVEFWRNAVFGGSDV